LSVFGVFGVNNMNHRYFEVDDAARNSSESNVNKSHTNRSPTSYNRVIGFQKGITSLAVTPTGSLHSRDRLARRSRGYDKVSITSLGSSYGGGGELRL